MDESRRKELELRLARLQEERERRVSAPDEPSPVDAALEVEADEDSWMEDFGEGIAASVLKTGYGVLDLVGGVGEGEYQLDPKRLYNLQEDAKDSWGGTAGNIVGEVGQFITGGGLLAKGGLKLAKKAKAAGGGSTKRKALKKTARAISTPGIAREMGIAGGLGGLQYANENESRGGNALVNAGLVGVGGLAVKGIGKAIRGANRSPAAQELLEAGVYVPPGKAAEGAFVRGMHSLMRAFPTAAKAHVTSEARGLREYADYVANILGKDLGLKENVGRAGAKYWDDTAKVLSDAVKKGYDDAWALSPILSDKVATNMTQIINKAKVEGVGATKLNTIANRIKTVRENSAFGPVDPDRLRKLDKLIKKTKSFNDADGINVYLDDLYDAMRLDMSTTALTALKKMDDVYPAFKTFKDVVSKATKTPEEALTSQGLKNSSYIMGNKGGGSFLGSAPLLKEGRLGAETIGLKMNSMILDQMKAIMHNVPTWQGGYEAMGRAVMGDTFVQKALQRNDVGKIMSAVRDAVRKTINKSAEAQNIRELANRPGIQQAVRPTINRLEEMGKRLRTTRNNIGLGSVFAGMEQ